jgi:Holliday junction resolvasome RuvABC endonuclease subunit
VLALGVDSATKTGLAIVVFNSGKFSLVKSKTVTINEPMDVPKCRLGPPGFEASVPITDMAAIEMPYLARGERANPSTLQKLSRIFGWWEYYFARSEIPCMHVNAQQWQSAILGRCVSRTERKKAAIVFCMRMFKVELSSDEADAACIAYWAIKQQLSKGKR